MYLWYTIYGIYSWIVLKETLIFDACLADNVNKQLKVTNPSPHSIGFTIKKFDPNNCFSLTNVNNNFLKIAGNSSKILDINFFAKYVTKVTGKLLRIHKSQRIIYYYLYMFGITYKLELLIYVWNVWNYLYILEW